MTQAGLAESILALAMPPERAASTVGDLLEHERQPLRFWGALARTAGAFVWKSAPSDGVQAARGALVSWCSTAVTLLLWYTLWNIPGMLMEHGLGELPGRVWLSLPGYWGDPGVRNFMWGGWVFSGVGVTRGKEAITWLVAPTVWILLSLLTRVPTDDLTSTIAVWAFSAIGILLWRSRQSKRVKVA